MMDSVRPIFSRYLTSKSPARHRGQQVKSSDIIPIVLNKTIPTAVYYSCCKTHPRQRSKLVQANITDNNIRINLTILKITDEIPLILTRTRVIHSRTAVFLNSNHGHSEVKKHRI